MEILVLPSIGTRVQALYRGEYHRATVVSSCAECSTVKVKFIKGVLPDGERERVLPAEDIDGGWFSDK